MAAGIPVIATAVGAIPDVMSEGIHGFLVPPRDGKSIAEALALLSGDRERLSWMSRACRRRIRAAYSIERVAAQLALHYGELCGGPVAAAAGHPSVPAAPRQAAAHPGLPARFAGRRN
ncbi:MAG TPA: glycosyltransferase, partial [Myxococcota bacterium]|nr:glycosyltransferase [Myxococcota bacterium]